LVSTVAYSSLISVGEMTIHAPISGSFPHFAARWVDPAFGFAVGWNYFYTNAILIPVEITAAGILLTFWDPNTKHQIAYTGALCFSVCIINIFGVRYFGESEFIFAIIKLLMITGLIILGLVIDLGGGPNGERLGFRYWKNPGAFNGAGLVSKPATDRFLGIVSVIVQAAFSFQGMELVAIAASETESPRRNIAKAVRRVFYRILIFYMLGIFVTGLLVPYNDQDLLKKTGNAAQSPFVIAMSRAGIKVLPHIINGGIFTSAFSAGNSFLFCSSRILYGLALRQQAPRYLTYCTKGGLPLAAVMTSAAFSLLSFMNISAGATTVFNWLVNLTTTGGFVSWWAICVTYVFFYRGLKAQGFDRKRLFYAHPLQPYAAYWGVLWNTIFILITGFKVFWGFNAADFFTSYINVPIFVGLYLCFKFLKRTAIWKPAEMDFVTGVPSIEESEVPEVKATTFWGKLFQAIF